MNEDGLSKAERQTLSQQYAEVCKSHDAITDLRIKLLGFLPLAAGTGLFLVLKDKTLAAYLGAIGLFGSAVTLGLFFYELRGMKECLELRTYGEDLEKALGLTDKLRTRLDLTSELGRFQGTRPKVTGPQAAGWMIYPAVLGAWLYVSAVGFSWPRWVRLLLVVVYVIIVAWRLLYLWNNNVRSRSKQGAGPTPHSQVTHGRRHKALTSRADRPLM